MGFFLDLKFSVLRIAIHIALQEDRASASGKEFVKYTSIENVLWLLFILYVNEGFLLGGIQTPSLWFLSSNIINMLGLICNFFFWKNSCSIDNNC